MATRHRKANLDSAARSAQAAALSRRARMGVRSCDAVDEPLALTVGVGAGAPTLSIAVGAGTTADPAPAVDGASVTALAIQYDMLSYLNALDLPAQVTVSATDRTSRFALSHLAPPVPLNPVPLSTGTRRRKLPTVLLRVSPPDSIHRHDAPRVHTLALQAATCSAPRRP